MNSKGGAQIYTPKTDQKIATSSTTFTATTQHAVLCVKPILQQEWIFERGNPLREKKKQE
jgi:hypothetical protein